MSLCGTLAPAIAIRGSGAATCAAQANGCRRDHDGTLKDIGVNRWEIEGIANAPNRDDTVCVR
jgi:hypothetical protein